MKKYFFIAAAAIVALASCTKTANLETAQREINFEVAKYINSTKASGSVYDQDVPFGTYSWFNKTQAFMSNDKVAYASGAWKTTPNTYYWPKTGSITFVSWSPYTVSPASVTVNGISFTNFTAGSVDLMAADIATCSSNVDEITDGDGAADSGFTGVPTLFRHLLAKVSFKIKANFLEWGTAPNKTTWEVKIQSLKISGIYTKGDCALTWGTGATKWTAPTDSIFTNLSSASSEQELVASEMTLTTSDQDLAAFATTYVIPQNLSDNQQKITVQYTIKTTLPNGNEINESKTATLDLNDISSLDKWQMNQNIVYSINFKPTASDDSNPHNNDPEDVIITFDPAVADWTTVNAGATVQI